MKLELSVRPATSLDSLAPAEVKGRHRGWWDIQNNVESELRHVRLDRGVDVSHGGFVAKGLHATQHRVGVDRDV